MKVLVLGGTRFIGLPVVRRLLEQAHDVTVFHRGLTEPRLPRQVNHLHGDRQRLADFAAGFRQIAPDVVIDMTAYSETDARAVVAAFRGVARRLVVVSSQDVYRAYGRFHGNEAGMPEPVPIREDAAFRQQLYPYRGTGRGLDDYDKILVERAATAGLPTTVLRLPMVYGEGDYQRRLYLELRRMDDGRPAIFLEETFARWRWSRAYVENAAAAIALAATDHRAVDRVYNVAEPDALTYAEWVRAVGRAAGWPGAVVTVADGRLPPSLRPPGGDYAQHLVADTTRIRLELGYVEPVALAEALQRTIEWERSHRPRGEAKLDYSAEEALMAEVGWGAQPTTTGPFAAAGPFASAPEAPASRSDLPPFSS